MTRKNKANKERVFTVELRSNRDIRGASFEGDKKVFIEGSLGPLKKAHFEEDLVLEIVGENGALRVDLSRRDLEKISPGDDVLLNGQGGCA